MEKTKKKIWQSLKIFNDINLAIQTLKIRELSVMEKKNSELY